VRFIAIYSYKLGIVEYVIVLDEKYVDIHKCFGVLIDMHTTVSPKAKIHWTKLRFINFHRIEITRQMTYSDYLNVRFRL
jgi:hypothetical protein